jgi:hypothetical protein
VDLHRREVVSVPSVILCECLVDVLLKGLSISCLSIHHHLLYDYIALDRVPLFTPHPYTGYLPGRLPRVFPRLIYLLFVLEDYLDSISRA